MEMTPKSDLQQYFAEHGYVAIDTCLKTSTLETIVDSLSPYFGDDRVEPRGVPFSDYGRVQDAWYLDKAVWQVATSKVILEALEHLYGATAIPFQTLNFYKGTAQPTHADSIHFNCEPFGMMCGVWVALEDIGPDQGPLRLYPGSNKLPEMNYQDFGLAATADEYPNYLKGVEKLIEENAFTESRAMIKQGQAIIWGANTLHGGSPQNDMALTRHSQVTHYYMGAPKAWRPSLSPEKREYFKPDVVRNLHTIGHRMHTIKNFPRRLRYYAGRAKQRLLP